MTSSASSAGPPEHRGGLTLPPRVLDAAFPFYLAFDEQLMIRGLGPVLQRLVPQARIGQPVTDVAHLVSPPLPFTVADFAAHPGALVLLRLLPPTGPGLTLRGQVVVDDDSRTALFLGSPAVNDAAELFDHGLSMEDFAVHDSLLDRLYVNQAQAIAVRDAAQLATRLHAAQAESRRLADAEKALSREIESRHDQKLEALGRLSAGIAHEINTPIQFVGDNTRFLASSYSTMLELLLEYRACLDGGPGALSWQERRDRMTNAEAAADIDYLASEVPLAVQQSLEGIERVATLVRAMKAFSYRDQAERGHADLNDALRTTLTVARNEIKYVADIALQLGDIPPVVCHVGSLNQVFLNLLVNAADALQGASTRGTISVTTSHDAGWVTVSVQDNGPGIPPDIIGKIFEPFFTTKDVGHGTGQGLALARAVVVQNHGGSIEVFSEPGSGTRFEVRLPVEGPGAGAS
ncbi:MAG: domain S-box protein [Frankiales bacterium]|nr:domain S-box protein [Frankiales bacterium]